MTTNIKTYFFVFASVLLLFASFLCYDSSITAQSGKKPDARYSGAEVIRKAIAQFQMVKTIDSEVRLKCHFFGEGYGGRGYYREKRLPTVEKPAVSPNLFQFVVKLADSSNLENNSSTLRVTVDGSDLWKNTIVENERRAERVDMAKLQDILVKSQKGNGAGGRSDNQSPSVGLDGLMSLGGLEGTLIQLSKFYDFDSALVESASLGSEENLAVWKVSAKLRPDRLQTMIAAYGGEKAIAKFGGEHILSAICVYFGQADLFPYRICYYGGVKEEPYDDLPNIDLEYFHVSINGADISTEIFRNNNPDNESGLLDDVTEFYLNRMSSEDYSARGSDRGALQSNSL